MEEKPTLVGLLNTIFTSSLSCNEKIKRLENVYYISSTEKIKEEVSRSVCDICFGLTSNMPILSTNRIGIFMS